MYLVSMYFISLYCDQRELHVLPHSFPTRRSSGLLGPLRGAGSDAGHATPRLAEALRMLAGEQPLYLQQPSVFYFPGLAQRPFFERSDFAWAGGGNNFLFVGKPLPRQHVSNRRSAPCIGFGGKIGRAHV